MHVIINLQYFFLFQIYAFTSMGVVILSTVIFVLSTMPELTDDIDMIPVTNTSDPNAGAAVERWEDVCYEYLHIIFSYIDNLGNFSFESS